jgi:hypothetical protein
MVELNVLIQALPHRMLPGGVEKRTLLGSIT